MAKQVQLFRYYGKNSPKNYPSGLAKSKLISGSAFTSCPSILSLGIQTAPGTKFYLNYSENPIIIGSVGVYELDLSGDARITNLRFASDSLDLIDDNDNGYLIIDVLYEEGN